MSLRSRLIRLHPALQVLGPGPSHLTPVIPMGPVAPAAPVAPVGPVGPVDPFIPHPGLAHSIRSATRSGWSGGTRADPVCRSLLAPVGPVGPWSGRSGRAGRSVAPCYPWPFLTEFGQLVVPRMGKHPFSGEGQDALPVSVRKA